MAASSPHRIALAPGADLDGFRRAVRHLLARDAAPEDVIWETADDAGLWSGEAVGDAPPVGLPKQVGKMIATVICHRDPERFALLYELAWRARHGERALLEVASDRLTHRLGLLFKGVRRDVHKMQAFVRFRAVEDPEVGERFVAWYEPDHFILELVGAFFAERFRSMIWSILTPVGSLHWNRQTLTLGPPAARGDGPLEDAFEAGWRDYYENIFNPARLNPRAMRAEMPRRFWRNLPEAASIEKLIQEAPARVAEMHARLASPSLKRDPEKAVADMFDQAPKTLEALNKMIRDAGPLVPGATQAVLGEGPLEPAIAFVGEQPGDMEDVAGRPFVGPAGQVLDRALAEAGIDRAASYMTNAVKHFKFELKGSRRIHQKPTTGEVKHYRPWLLQELDLVRPRLVVTLGATALLAVTGEALSVTRVRGARRMAERSGFVTVHPSYLLRLPDEAAKAAEYGRFVADLRRAAELAGAA